MNDSQLIPMPTLGDIRIQVATLDCGHTRVVDLDDLDCSAADLIGVDLSCPYCSVPGTQFWQDVIRITPAFSRGSRQ